MTQEGVSDLVRTEVVSEWTARVQSEYNEMPGLSLTPPQAWRLWGLDRHTCTAILSALTARGFLKRTPGGRYIRARS